MSKLVVRGATLRCNKGSSTGTLSLRRSGMTADDSTIATVQDYLPLANIPAFGTCGSLANPQVSSATSAANGVLQRMPCVPVTTSPWSPGSSLADVEGVKALTDDSTCDCSYNGTISITNAANTVETD